jgi:ferric iron reductase protein FhuF
LRLNDLWWQDRLGGAFPLSVRLDVPTDQRPAITLAGSAVQAVTTTVARRYAVSETVVWGNVASAVNSAAQQLSAARPDVAKRAIGIAGELLADRHLDGEPVRSGPGFRRNSCCLIYHVADDTSAVCGDCVLGSRSRRESGT